MCRCALLNQVGSEVRQRYIQQRKRLKILGTVDVVPEDLVEPFVLRSILKEFVFPMRMIRLFMICQEKSR